MAGLAEQSGIFGQGGGEEWATMAGLAEQPGLFNQGGEEEWTTEASKYEQRGTQTDGQEEAGSKVGQLTETVADSVQGSDDLRPTPSRRRRGRPRRIVRTETRAAPPSTSTKGKAVPQGSAGSTRVTSNTRVDLEPEVFVHRLRSGRVRK